MNKNFKFASAIISAGLLITSTSSIFNNTQVQAKENFQITTYKNELNILVEKPSKNEIDNYLKSKEYKISQKIEQLLTINNKTKKIEFKINPNQLASELDISKEEAIKLNNLVNLMPAISGIKYRDFVGFYLNIGDYTKTLAPAVAGAFAAAYTGWYLKNLATKGPWGAGAAAAITTAVGGTVGYAVSKGLNQTKVGIDIPWVSYSETINLP